MNISAYTIIVKVIDWDLPTAEKRRDIRDVVISQKNG